MDLGLRGKVALVAASSHGLGRAVAEELASEGADLLLCARGEEGLNKARAEIIDKTGVRVLAVAANLTEPDEVKRVVDTGLEESGNIDILITNTGGPPPGIRKPVTTLIDAVLPAGAFALQWDGKNDKRQYVTNNLYTYELTAGDFTDQKELFLDMIDPEAFRILKYSFIYK